MNKVLLSKFDINPKMKSSPLRIGINEWSEYYPFNGIIDDFRVYNRVLNDKEIKKLYSLGENKNNTDKNINNTGLTNFVKRFYEIILDREPDEEGLNDWVNKLSSHKATGADIARGFILSPEFKNKNYSDEEYITKLYEAFFDREPDSDGFDYWMRILTLNSDNPSLGRREVLDGFLTSQEFENLSNKYGIKAF
jgi:hypothetical protein